MVATHLGRFEVQYVHLTPGAGVPGAIASAGRMVIIAEGGLTILLPRMG